MFKNPKLPAHTPNPSNKKNNPPNNPTPRPTPQIPCKSAHNFLRPNRTKLLQKNKQKRPLQTKPPQHKLRTSKRTKRNLRILH